MQNKPKRQQALLHAVQTRIVGSYQELRTILRGRGFEVDVATISRDIRELGIVKASSKGRHGRSSFKYVLGEAAAPRGLGQVVRDFVDTASVAKNFLVIKTRPQYAVLVASEIDKAGWTEVLGTIAADNTIIGICQSRPMAVKALKRLRSVTE